MDEPPTTPKSIPPANDGRPADEVEARIDAAVMTLARLLGRQIAREEFRRREEAAANGGPGDDDS